MGVPRNVIVVGAGIVGCSVAYELARRGASVQILENRAVGMGATQASAGVLAPYIEARDGSPLLDLTVRSLSMYDEFVDRVARDDGVSIPYRRIGTLNVATDEAELQGLRTTADVLGRRGVPAVLLDAVATKSEEPLLADGIAGGLLIAEHGHVAAHDLARGLVGAACRSGAQLVEHRRVERIRSRGGSEIVVDTDSGAIRGDAVVLAAGTWSGTIAIDGIDARVPVRPVRGQLVYLKWKGTPLRRITWSGSCYMVPWEDGTVLLGATSEDAGFDERLTVSGVHDLLHAASEVAPHVWTATFAGARVGLRPATIDNLPVIGPSPSIPNLIYATGHYRNGILLAPLTAQLVADVLLDGTRDPMLETVAPSRFEGL